MELLLVAVLALLAIAAATAFAPRLGVASPLLLVVLGLGVGLLPIVPEFEIDPEWIIAGVLPPLLYSAAVSMPTMEFRRDFGAISGLSVVLVVITSVALGFVFAWLIPGLGIAGGIALGAIVSPTDAVATSIVKRLGVSPRVVAMLEGESLLNDASALVLLRSAIAGIAASVSIWGVAVDFVYAVVVALIIGVIVGWVNLRVRARVVNPTVNTVISFTIPFLAAVPAEALGASGLVAAVVAGLITGRGGPRFLSPQHRQSDVQNWRTIELVLEGAVFLIMGLELEAIIDDVDRSHDGIGNAVLIAAIALAATILIRAAYVAPLIAGLAKQTRRGATIKHALASRAEGGHAPFPLSDRNRARLEKQQRLLKQATKDIEHPKQTPAQRERFRTMFRRRVADIDYYLDETLSWREGTVVVWAGMRGVVTLAAAQTLPADTPSRSLLVFIAFLVSVGSLMIQGGTLPWIVKWILPARDHDADLAERRELRQVLRAAAAAELSESDDPALRAMAERTRAAWQLSTEEGPDDDETDASAGESNAAETPAAGATTMTPFTAPFGLPIDHRSVDPEQVRLLRLRMIHREREALLVERDEGRFRAATLSAALEDLDAEQISIEIKAPPS